jgi:phosphoglycolate phosphatase
MLPSTSGLCQSQSMHEDGRFILWDVDGTLVSAGPVAREAFDLAVRAVLGGLTGRHDVQMSGKTDPQIAREIMAELAVPEAEAERRLPEVLAALEEELERAETLIHRAGKAHPGVPDVLEALASRPGVVQSVVSGNLAANARLKLAAFGLDRWLDLEVGAYGSDHADRNELVPLALRRVERLRRRRFDPSQVWVVGDTPLDLGCAQAAGARCLLVGTGRFGFVELAPLEADAVLPDLGDMDEVLAILTGSTSRRVAEGPPDGVPLLPVSTGPVERG